MAAHWGHNKPQSAAEPPVSEKPFIEGACPECGAAEIAVVNQIYSWRFNGDSVIVTVAGARMSCQRCPCVFSVNRNGSFRHHAQSLPWTPSPKMMDEAMPQREQERVLRKPPMATNDPLPFRQQKK
jgi:hypothetical protein